VLLALLLAACSGGSQPPPGPEIASITLSPETATLEVGQTQTFSAVAREASGNPVSASFSWASSSPQVASIADGLATGLAEGSTQITASSGGVTSNAATLTVIPGGGSLEPPAIASFTANPATIAPGEASTLSWSVSGATSLSISADIGPAIGTVTGSSITVRPARTTTYTLTATNAAGEDSASTTVTVAGTEPPVGVSNTIAYVRPNDESGDEIRLINPDGSGDRLLWSTDQPDPYGVEEISSLAWRPDGGELAFASDHEGACSIFEADLYSVLADGSGYRRITNAPACAELAGYPKGAVVVEVENRSESYGPFFVYVQGAPGVKIASLGGTGVGSVLFEEVADLGEGVLQFVMVTDARYRWWGLPVDVRAGATVAAPRQVLLSDALSEFGAWWPSWHLSGTKLGYVLGLGIMHEIGANPGLLAIGEFLLAEGAETAGVFNGHLAWGPTPALADSFLYATFASDDFALDGIYLAVEGGRDRGDRIVAIEFGLVQGLAWLPDGSGFVYSVTESFDSYANIYAYSFATGQVTQLTSFTDEFAVQLSVSPDGQSIVFERVADLYFPTEPASLWIMSLNGGGLRLLVENGRAPAWSR
jgi:PKD repeat protein